jgi:hypothetical protein
MTFALILDPSKGKNAIGLHKSQAAEKLQKNKISLYHFEAWPKQNWLRDWASRDIFPCKFSRPTVAGYVCYLKDSLPGFQIPGS